VYARLLKADFEPLTVPRVKAKLKHPDQSEEEVYLDLEPKKEKEGAYRVQVPNDQPGLWQISVEEPAKATMTFNVKVPDKHELQEAPMAIAELTKAANETKPWGGRFYREQDLHELVAAITPQETMVRSRQEVLLWGWIPFVLFVGLVTLEWVLRKFANLS
jgi:hypothetical protein